MHRYSNARSVIDQNSTRSRVEAEWYERKSGTRERVARENTGRFR
jgi:hypothetical protein